jgi:hypothetical protein
MDTLDPNFENLIVEQCARHLEKIPAFEGIAIDRLDYSEFFNYDADDGVSWVPRNGSGDLKLPPPNGTVWGPARALRLSYRHTFGRLHEVLHTRQPAGKKKMLLNNCNTLCRVDEMRAFDGTFSEGSALNMVAWTGLRNPTILWTYSLSADPAVFDPWFQEHLLMNVYPMAPMPKNDHAITPEQAGPVVEQAYRDYAALFDKMHGCRWLLSSQPLGLRFTQERRAGANTSTAAPPPSPPPLAASVNVFTLPRKRGRGATGPSGSESPPPLLIPLVLAGANATATLSLNLTSTQSELGWAVVGSVDMEALHPGEGAPPVKLGRATAVGPALWEMNVPLLRGMALVTATLHAA